ncbi:hypothetical protein ASG92_25860 [Arthrobacter sp. Soil736]|nr:hypothetical protein ASG92_25860 [Arthrobacter sp. Soil736]
MVPRNGTRPGVGPGCRGIVAGQGSGFDAPAGGPAGGLAGWSGRVDCRGAGPVHSIRGEQLQVVDPAGELLHEVREICSITESGQRQLIRHALNRGFSQSQALQQVLSRPALEGSMPVADRPADGRKAGGSTAVGLCAAESSRSVHAGSAQTGACSWGDKPAGGSTGVATYAAEGG